MKRRNFLEMLMAMPALKAFVGGASSPAEAKARAGNLQLFLEAMEKAEKKLPDNVHLFVIDQYWSQDIWIRKFLFPIYGCSGGLASSHIFYLVSDKDKDGKYFAHPIEFTHEWLANLQPSVIEDVVAAVFDKGAKDIAAKAHEINLNGGDMGRGKFDGTFLGGPDVQ